MSIPCPVDGDSCGCDRTSTGCATFHGFNYVGRHRLSSNWEFQYIELPGWLTSFKVNLNGGAFK